MEEFSTLKATVSCEQPNDSLYTFKGNVTIGDDTVPVAVEQILLRVRIIENICLLFRVQIFVIPSTFMVLQFFVANIAN
jgi:hypothetical protein